MKTLITLTICLFTLIGVSKADNDTPIKMNELPQKAQEFIKKHFPKSAMSHAKMDKEMMNKNYEVVFVNGTKVEFDKKGEWKEIDCQKDPIPTGIVPREIVSHLSKHYPDTKITKIEKDAKGYEIKLNNDLELKYSPTFKLREIDN